ncbi:MarR family transcriptional regulator [Burkholderia sp. Ac-20392]|uniref:MarR family winged helix-turn-helix transcriptional regulator n=1 Tax=Burkholderia sp. Ac-20392 TaxID=2703905 RepID=UPI00197E7F01|nr:MarR family transcriptional regulator [Burkholderia sp. Ac-20392]MBN3793708.1 MarR family transcriptional regulator [Burkholderia sp. Ac-20392]
MNPVPKELEIAKERAREMAPGTSGSHFVLPERRHRGMSIVPLLSAADSLQSRCIDRRVEQALGITKSQASILHVLDDEASLTAGELADACGIAGSAVTRLVDRLEAQYLVVRTQKEDDRRVVYLSLTCDGRRIAAAWRDLQDEIQCELRAFASDDELRLLGNLLSRMLGNAARGDATG